MIASSFVGLNVDYYAWSLATVHDSLLRQNDIATFTIVSHAYVFSVTQPESLVALVALETAFWLPTRPSIRLYFATIETTSSSETTCPNPTLCGTCLALAPHTSAYLNVSFNVRWTWLHTSSIVEPVRTISASEKSGSIPFLKHYQSRISDEVVKTIGEVTGRRGKGVG
jgi:hypothetical protein